MISGNNNNFIVLGKNAKTIILNNETNNSNANIISANDSVDPSSYASVTFTNNTSIDIQLYFRTTPFQTSTPYKINLNTGQTLKYSEPPGEYSFEVIGKGTNETIKKSFCGTVSDGNSTFNFNSQKITSFPTFTFSAENNYTITISETSC
jgi:hypothetical protein